MRFSVVVENRLPVRATKGVRAKGFTLIELLVAISIVAVVIAAGLMSYDYIRKQARDSRRRADLEEIASALERYYNKNHAYPVGNVASDQSCWIENKDEPAGCHKLYPLVSSGFIPVIPVDPGLNKETDAPTSDCDSGQFYSYKSDDGKTYLLAAVQEVGGGDCACKIGDRRYRYCLGQGADDV